LKLRSKVITSENKTSEKTTAIKVLETINPASGTIISTDPLISQKRPHEPYRRRVLDSNNGNTLIFP
jgi:hypothetical protein